MIKWCWTFVELTNKIMKKTRIVLISMLLLSVINCKNDKSRNSIKNKEPKNEIVKDLDYYLINGIKSLDNYAGVEQKLTEDVYLRGFAFYKKAENDYSLILELQNDISSKIVSKYTFAVEGFAVEEELDSLSEYAKSKNRTHEAWFTTPPLIKINNHSYVILDAKTKLKELILIKFFLFDKGGYKGDIGKRIEYINYWIE